LDCAVPPRGQAVCWTGASGDEPGRCAASVPAEKGAACFTPLGKADPKNLSFSECNDDPGMRCDPASNTCGPRVRAGGACEQGYECEAGAACVGKKCKALAGAACKSSRECATGQACVDGKCGPGKKLGEACKDLADCAEGSCVPALGRCASWAARFTCKPPSR
jgi:hypothetical protein